MSLRTTPICLVNSPLPLGLAEPSSHLKTHPQVQGRTSRPARMMPAALISFMLLGSFAGIDAHADSITPYSVNDNGLIVGQDFTTSNTYRAFVYDPNTGTFTFLSPPGATNAIAVGINDNNQIVGSYGSSTGNFGYLYSGGVFSTISVLGAYQTSPSQFFSGTGTVASGINGAGVIVGSWNPSVTAPETGFIYDGTVFTNTSISDGGRYTDLYGINDSGEISGYAIAFSGRTRTYFSFVYNSGVFTPISYPGATSTIVQGINDNGVVVGFYSLAGVTSGFIYDNGTYTSMMYPGASTTNLFGISNNGEIVGSYTCTSGACPFSDPGFFATPNGSGGYSFQTIADPTPEPGTMAIFVGGLGLLAVNTLRRRKGHLAAF